MYSIYTIPILMQDYKYTPLILYIYKYKGYNLNTTSNK